MATSSFQKQFVVKKKKINTFVKEMSKEATPKLNEDFKSKFTSDKNIIEKIIGTLK
ncbi:hypothetical protein [Fusobacterium pseudoperiodonticum]|jgi:hypothetical protein|uniref:hypothetical protein n=1 Tax=Fusobacterium pseudoperiodonticum TaxID=2663009 RepID=UPI0028D5B4DB|nr:hypothetical protein [Fusobacterium pseudoperiodonticum]